MSTAIATASSHIRHQKKNQTARQAMMISGLQTIYRNNSATNAIQKNIRSETKIYLLDITISDINEKYSKIHQIIETGRLKPKGTEQYFVKKQREHLLVTENGIYEIKSNTNHNNSGGYNKNNNKRNGNGASVENTTSHLEKKSIVDGMTNTTEVKASIVSENKANTKQLVIPVLIDESYYQQSESSIHIHHIPIEHSYIIQVKKTVRFHNNAPNAFVFVFDENEKQILDFYMTTDNGIVHDKLNTSFKDDMISFLLQFKLY